MKLLPSYLVVDAYILEGNWKLIPKSQVRIFYKNETQFQKDFSAYISKYICEDVMKDKKVLYQKTYSQILGRGLYVFGLDDKYREIKIEGYFTDLFGYRITK